MANASNGQRLVIDDIDRELIELLRRDGRRTNRELAGQVGLTEVTVAARLRRLIDADVFTVRPHIDWVAAGFNVHAIVTIRVKGSPTRVATSFEVLPGVHSVNLLLGDDHILLSLVAPELSELHAVIAQVITHPDVVAADVEQSVEYFRYAHQEPTLPAQAHIELEDLPNPVLALDALDRDIVQQLRNDGRGSYRKIARKLGVSDGTVGIRIRRMDEAGLMRIAAVSDRSLAGEAALALVGITVPNPLEVAKTLLRSTQVRTCMSTVGRFNLVFFISAPRYGDVSRWLNDHVWTLPGLLDARSWLLVETTFIKSDLVRFLD